VREREGTSVLSTFAQDILLRENGEVISRQSGGPILFLERALQASNVPFHLLYGETIDVEILMTDHGEFGRISNPPKILPFPLEEVADWVVVSTVLKEWELDKIERFQGKVFVDIQGYVRSGQDFGRKQVWQEATDFAEKIFCMKGTRQEVSFLPESVREDQKNRLLIATDGGNGLELFYEGKNFYVPAGEPIKPRDTIGAGDTFFGYFVAAMYKGADPENAAKHATEKTRDFLLKK
jgi:sugar/nucleoside kinase (ribokinase family)